MEKCFSIALLLLVGHLQAKPCILMDMDDLGFELLQSASCNDATFISPTYTEGKCLTAALELFIQGLEHAEKKCDTVHHIRQTKEALIFYSSQQTETDCNFTTTVHKKFADFVEATETFVQQFNVHQSSKQ